MRYKFEVAHCFSLWWPIVCFEQRAVFVKTHLLKIFRALLGFNLGFSDLSVRGAATGYCRDSLFIHLLSSSGKKLATVISVLIRFYCDSEPNRWKSCPRKRRHVEPNRMQMGVNGFDRPGVTLTLCSCCSLECLSTRLCPHSVWLIHPHT